MIKLIGLKRIILLSVLFALNLLVGCAYFFGVSPMLEEAQTQLSSINGQISQLQGKISGIKQDVAYVNENLPAFKDLEGKGFFLQQDRFMIGREMETLRARTGISSFAFSIGDVQEVPNPDATAIDYKLINSRIKIDRIVSPLDTNVYVLMQEMSEVFPEYSRIQSVDMTRVAEVTETSLKDIAAGKAVNFVNASVTFDWLTLVPKSDDKAAPPVIGTSPGFRGR
jgi:hypothetical protein